ncbi:MAG: PAS-domain containing protein, partial [Pseudomonadota bacterium]|nr:PAS-domain containing protein [Pseudomonadota bacterium]
MIELSRTALAALAAVSGAWLLIALWAALHALRQARQARAARLQSERAQPLLEASPALPLVVEPDGRLEGSDRLAGLLGLGALPQSWAELTSSGVLAPGDAEALSSRLGEAASAGSQFVQPLRPLESRRTLHVRGAPAPPPWPAGAALLWFVDATETEDELAGLRAELARHRTALDALSAVIEAAPFPMWHRGPDLALAMVNGAYVAAVEAADASEVVSAGIELIDEGGGRVPAREAALVRERGEPSHRTVPATIAGERRTMHVVEVPLGEAGIAGFAIDVEEREQARAELARFVRAQRDMLDRLSAGVAQFGRDRSLIFFNQPFARLFSLSADFLADRPEFDRVIDAMREGGNLPEVRDFPDWKEERRAWFTAGLAAAEEDWLLPGGKHLRVVAQPLPDGGLLAIFEDRTEQIQLASARDTLLRVRTATFDNLFEAVGVFASDGRLHLWNNRFRELWEFEEEQLAAHPRVDSLTPHIAAKLLYNRDAGLL